MKRGNQAVRGTVALALAGYLVWAGSAQAQTMDQYFAVPPFVSDQVAPNIILVLDNSGSMSGLGCDQNGDGDCVDSADLDFVNTTKWSGYFDSLTCYTYDTGDNRFEPATVRATLATACSSTQWDGNYLNWATFRRFDALKKAMIGGDCVAARAADGTCPATGTPALKTVRAQANGVNTESALATYNGGTGLNTYVGRIPTADTSGTPSNLYIGTAAAYFCVDNDNSFNSNCGDSYSVRKYELRIGYSTEPTGTIQQIGAQARFGLFEFKPTGDGARMLVGVGSRQSIDFSGSTVETFNTNTAAMIDAVQESFPSTWTPLSESLYETTRYIAQINSTYLSSSYVYPIAYAGGNSNGVAFQGNGVGSIGGSEITALTGTEVCPAGYITNACGRDPYFFGSNHTPAWATTSTKVACCKTFVILVTDGEPTQDTNIPAGLQDYAHGRHGLHCNGGNATIHAPNGTCNTNSATPPATLLGEHKTDYGSSGNHYLDDVAYWAHTNDLRPCNGSADGQISVLNVTGHCLPGLQNVTVYTFFAFGNIAGRELLMHAAQLGGFEDTNGNNIPDLVSEWDKVINATGAPGSDGIPDNYFESSNVDDLQDRLMATITAILRKSASGTSISVLATSATGEGSIYQAYFFTSDVGQSGANVKWTGYSHALFVDGFGNFREDTNQDGKLTYDQDLIVTTRYDNNPTSPTYKKVLVDKFVDANADGVADSTTPTFTGDLKSIKPIWEAGTELANATSASRKILTWVDTNNDGIVDPTEQIDFSAANCAALRDYLRYPGDTCAGGTNATNLINFIRGDEIAGLRTRMLEVPVGSGSYKVWRLGDPIHSTPTVVGAPKARYDLAFGDPTYTAFYAKYRNRRQVVYVGANDGMLHAFNGGYYHKGDDPTTAADVEHGWYTKNPTDNSSGANLGAELWSFIPQELLPHLQWLARTDYTHVYYVDLKPTIAEARIFTPDADHPGGWGTVLIGGFRMGGSCGNCAAGSGAPPMTVTIGGVPRTFYSAYFALDITNPEVDPKLLWVFSDSQLGLTTSYPAVARMNPKTDSPIDPTNEKWYVLFGSGPNGYQASLSAASPQNGTLYTVDLKKGPKVAAGGSLTTMPVGTWQSFMGHVVAVDKDSDWRTDVAYSVRTIHDGALPWRGKLYRLTMGCSTAPCDPNTWGIANGGNRTPTEVIDTFYDASLGTTVEVGPSASAPTVTLDDADKMWVFFGTGRYFSNADKVDNTIQRLFGIKDSVLSATCTETSTTSCHDDDLVNVTNAVICIVCSGSTNQVTDPTNPGVTTFNGTGTTSMIGLVASKDGWRVTMPGTVNITDPVTLVTTNYSAERSVVNPTLVAGTVFFPTFAPANDFCASDGASYLYALFYQTGTASTAPVIGTATSGSNTNVNAKTSLGTGLASSGTIHCGQGCSYNVQMSTGAFTQGNVSLEGNYSRYVNWVHQRD
ncbi:MAG: PilC/PilY family type IV pilus protein [Nitrospira sp.]|nr:PilC/PilY family type IV pilus protein [Nitrospira sp.]MDH5496297.1 PilC/PilY family type IV pilus protein [Nitrospira sp.]MDH5724702.1 PilC/PilY family type IV pilus protein [Nitrospira sp.]